MTRYFEKVIENQEKTGSVLNNPDGRKKKKFNCRINQFKADLRNTAKLAKSNQVKDWEPRVSNINFNGNEQHSGSVLRSKHFKDYHSNRIHANQGVGNQITYSDPDRLKGNRFRSQRVPITAERLERHSRGDGLKEQVGVKTKRARDKLLRKEKVILYGEEQAARSELLLTEQPGFLIPDEGEYVISQHEIARNVDITSATKFFDLSLPFGSYRMDYSRNGRFLLLGGRKGHIAAMDWVTKKLLCEINVMDAVYDVQWLHNETMYAVAQKDWVYIYDNQGIELHCLKTLYKVLRMEFLPYHFLLTTANEEGHLNWLDTSIGKLVMHTQTWLGRLAVMTQNPHNAVLCLGHNNGVVSMWTPNMDKPIAKMLCHKTAVLSIAVNHKGMYMATSSVDRSVCIWDIRNLVGPLESYRLRSAAANLAYSHRGLLATSSGNVIEVYKDPCVYTNEVAYLKHSANGSVDNLQFCPYEDVLGVATAKGFSSLLVPGCGEPNFDALESNPFESKKQRRETEVKALLEKIQPEMITLDPSVITEVDLPTLQDKVEAKKALLFIKPPDIDFTPRKKNRRHGNTVKAARTKKIMKEVGKREFVQTLKIAQEQDGGKSKVASGSRKSVSVLDRFKAPFKTKKRNKVA